MNSADGKGAFFFCQTLWLRTRFEAASAALKKGGVFAVHKTRATREGLSARTTPY
jgi:hypothetical protein